MRTLLSSVLVSASLLLVGCSCNIRDEDEDGVDACQDCDDQDPGLGLEFTLYADGDGVPHDDVRAFDYFRRIVETHGDDGAGQPQSRFVANAFVALGHYYREGIPDSPVTPDLNRARDMFSYAASYFGDPDAQFELGRLYLKGDGVKKDPKQAVRWLALAANKGQFEAQATLGEVLFRGENVPRQRPLGLMWLTLASDGSGDQVTWIADAREAAFKQATEDERALALQLIERRLGRGREW